MVVCKTLIGLLNLYPSFFLKLSIHLNVFSLQSSPSLQSLSIATVQVQSNKTGMSIVWQADNPINELWCIAFVIFLNILFSSLCIQKRRCIQHVPCHKLTLFEILSSNTLVSYWISRLFHPFKFIGRFMTCCLCWTYIILKFWWLCTYGGNARVLNFLGTSLNQFASVCKGSFSTWYKLFTFVISQLASWNATS